VVPERGSGGTNAFFEAITLTMNQVSGTEAQFVEFLYRVGASNSTIRVKELSLKPGNFDVRAQGRTNLVAESIRLVASVQKTAPASAGQPKAGSTAAADRAPNTSVATVSAPATRTNPAVSAVLRTNLPVRGLPIRTNVTAGAKSPRS
jgi:hypothetical protein